MFTAIEYYDDTRSNEYRSMIYLMEDSVFGSVKLEIKTTNASEKDYGSCVGAMETVIVAKEYLKRKMPVAKNVALMFLFFSKMRRNKVPFPPPRGNQFWIDKYFPELEYGTKYAGCVDRLVTELRWSRYW